VEENQAIMADLGEAQLISSQSHGRTYYGNEAFWAPEVRTHHTYSKASDVYAIGRLFYEMAIIHWQIHSSIHGSPLRRVLPLSLLQIIVACLKENPTERPSADVVNFDFEDIEQDILGREREIEFVDIDELSKTLTRSEEESVQQGKYDDIVF